jgi:hypothetical protein
MEEMYASQGLVDKARNHWESCPLGHHFLCCQFQSFFGFLLAWMRSFPVQILPLHRQCNSAKAAPMPQLLAHLKLSETKPVPWAAKQLYLLPVHTEHLDHTQLPDSGPPTSLCFILSLPTGPKHGDLALKSTHLGREGRNNLFYSHYLECDLSVFQSVHHWQLLTDIHGKVFGKLHADMFILLAVKMSKYARWMPSSSLNPERLLLKKSDKISICSPDLADLYQSFVQCLSWLTLNRPMMTHATRNQKLSHVPCVKVMIFQHSPVEMCDGVAIWPVPDVSLVF